MSNKDDFIDAVNEIKPSEELKKKTMHKIKEKKPLRFPYKLASAMSAVLVLFGLIFILDTSEVEEIPYIEIPTINNQMNLPTIGNMEKLLSILEKAEKQYETYGLSKEMKLATNDGMVAESAVSADSVQNVNNTSDYSKTNIQVNGVDEEDIVKTDGGYIYYISDNNLIISETGDNMRILSQISYNNQDNISMYPIGMYVDGNKLIVIFNKYQTPNYLNSTYIMYDMMYLRDEKTKIITYDITNKEEPIVYNEFEIDGNYISSRMVDNTVYLITNKYIYANYYKDDDKYEYLVQKYSNGINGEDKKILLSDICYIPESEDSSYLNIIAYDTQTKSDAKITTILGAGHNVYANKSNIYVTRGKNDTKENQDGTIDFKYKTLIYKFSINGKNIQYEANGEVLGNILSQYSMDEYNGNFRIAVTQNSIQDTTTSLYVLDAKLDQIGKIENLVDNERIYAVRFIGEKGYVVTFREMDPLFIIDLSNPMNPYVAGELELPGYSTYLHPYDENHIIGIGEDVEVKRNQYGNEYMERNGMKLSMFDISDASNPKEVFTAKVAPDGVNSSSEVSYNPKALLFSKEKNILAFPVSVYNVFTKYSEIGFQGVIVFGIDMENGFYERGRITNMEITNGYDDYEREKEIRRAVYIGNDIYTFSNTIIKRTDMNTFENLNEVEIEYNETPVDVWNAIIE